MKKEEGCPFCKSKTIMIDTPYVELKKSGEYGPIQTFCCLAQKRNAAYRKRFIGDAPSAEEVAKWK